MVVFYRVTYSKLPNYWDEISRFKRCTKGCKRASHLPKSNSDFQYYEIYIEAWGHIIAVECHITSPNPNIKDFKHPKEIEKLFQEYENKFRGLPHGRWPDRGFEHNIVLEEGTSPIQIPPYIHPMKLIYEIEKSIQELLYLGLIRPSSSTKSLQETHHFPLADHLGIFKTYRKLRKILFWNGMKEYVQKYVN